jgi:Zn-finger nucleic acid-binding protein
MISVQYEGIGVQRCDQCRGHLVKSTRLDSIKRIACKSQAELKDEATSEFHNRKTEKVKCPRCRITMRRQIIKLPGLPLETDICIPCSLIWFDGGELAIAQLEHESTAGFINAQEMKQRIEELEASPVRKAEFEKNLARLPVSPDPVEKVLVDVVTEILDAIMRNLIR